MNLIARQALKAHFRQSLSLRDISHIKRNIGNALKEPEMKSINMTREEALEFTNIIIREIFEELMADLKP